MCCVTLDTPVAPFYPEMQDAAWPPRWQQEAIDAVLPYLGTDDRLHILLGDPNTSLSGTAIQGHLYVEDRQPKVIYDRSGRSDVYPSPLLSGPVLRVELLRPKRKRRVLYSNPAWRPPDDPSK